VPEVRIQVAIPAAVSGAGFDGYVNTWHFATVGANPPEDTATEAIGWLTTFYQTLDDDFPSTLVASPATVKAYDLSDPEPRAPIVESTIALVPSAGTPLPPEVALCLSFRGNYVSGVQKARRRGRVFLGPYLATANSSSGRPTAGLIDKTSTAAGVMLTSSNASAETTWDVFSRVSSTPTQVVGGWVDDDWDIQRRRSRDLSTRDEFGEGHA